MMMMVMMVMVMMLLLLELLPHVISILTISIILSLNVMNLVAQGFGVEVKRGTVALADMKGNVLGSKDLVHGVLGGGHEFGGEAEFAVSAEDGEGGDVAVAIGGFFFHFGEDVADDATVVIFSDVEELRP